jgi:hypothetical protein
LIELKAKLAELRLDLVAKMEATLSAFQRYRPEAVIPSGAGLKASKLQLYRTIVSADSAITRLPEISIFASWPIRNVTTPAMIEQATSTTRPSVVFAVASLIQPMAYGFLRRATAMRWLS